MLGGVVCCYGDSVMVPQYCRQLRIAKEGVSHGGLGLLAKHRKRERLKVLLDVLKTFKTLVSGMREPGRE